MDFFRDLGLGFRSLWAKPGFAAVAILTLGVGIGANVVIYSLVQAVLLGPLPFAEPERLVQIWETAQREELELRSLSFPMLEELASSKDVFSEVAGLVGLPVNLGSVSGGEPERVRAEAVTASYFRLLDVELQRGRVFESGERTAVVVLSTSLWERRFGRDPDIVGERILINEVTATVLGVAEGGLTGDAELWLPLEAVPEILPRIRRSRFEQRGARWLDAVGRLAPDVTLSGVDAWMATETARLRRDHPRVMEDRGVLAVPLEDELFGDIQRTTTLLMAAVGLVLLIACANLTSLLLARGVERQQDIALRFALGATRWHVMRPLLAEALILAALGGAFGLVAAWWGHGLWKTIGYFEALPAYVTFSVDGRTIAFAAALSLVTAAAFGVAPAIASARQSLSRTLKRGVGTRPALVAVQVALAVLLTVASGLLMRSLTRQLAIDPGFRTESVYALRVQLPAGRYDGDASVAYTRALEERLEGAPGVRAVALATDVPLVDGYSALIARTEDAVRRGEDDRIRAYHHEVSPGFFRTFAIALTGGRDFTSFDDADAPLVAVVSEKFAARAWPNESALGKRVSIQGSDGPWRTIVGIVDDIRYRSLVSNPVENPDDPDIYLPLAQLPSRNLGIVLELETAGASLESVRGEIRALDPAIPVFAVQEMTDVLDAELALPRLGSSLLGGFGVLALALAALGLYGLLSQLVAQRSRDIGIRLALGARASHVVWGVLRRGMTMVLCGLGAGLVASLAAGRFLQSHLYEIEASDPSTLAACSVVLLVVAAAASYLPAKRATRIDPIRTLRQE